MRKGIILFFLFCLGAGLFIFTIKNVGLTQVSEAFFLLKKREFLLIFLALFGGTILVGTWKWAVILTERNKPRPRIWKMFLARWAGHSISYLTPSAFFGGEPVKILLLSREPGFSANRLISSVIIDRMIFFLISSIYFFIGIFFILFYLNLSWLVGIISFGLFFVIVFLFWTAIKEAKKISEKRGLLITLVEKLYLNRLNFIKKNTENIMEIEQEMKRFFRHSKKRVVKVFLLGVLEICFILTACWLTIYFMGIRLEITKLFAIRSITDISYAVPLPAALGVFEISQAYLFQLLGLGLAGGVTFSLIFRLASLLLAFIGMLIFGWLQLKYFFQRIIRLIINFFTLSSQNE
jgi:glycosyltransferase 2 family protein